MHALIWMPEDTVYVMQEASPGSEGHFFPPWLLALLKVGDKRSQAPAQVDEIDGLEHGTQPRAKVGSIPDGTVITVRGHGADLAPLWRHAGAALP
jgi:hypothetical protein